ncbi:MAG: TonB-dependent receptor [Campylobacterales bacterium]|nr:TonB-dependent receptor [Campylobacterales bacterium]
MGKTIVISLVLAPMLLAETVKMQELQVEAKINSVKISDVSGEELKSADLAESLSETVPSISLVRRSGIANDIILRGQKKDNINVLADGTKTYGACPNRMDPATSHILTNNIESVEVTEGPFDVENFGTLSGMVDIKTKKPSKELSGEVNLNAGSFNYKKASATVSGGTEKVRVLLSASTESSDQYKDGNGNTFADQIDNYLSSTAKEAYQPARRDMKAFEKKSFMGKLFFNPTDNQELRLSYTANRSDNVLYPSSAMDALYDDSDIYNLEYSVHNMGTFSKQLDFQVYHSEVEHPMSTKYRNTSGEGSVDEMVSALTSSMDGIKLKNLMEVGEAAVTVGLDASRRNWDGSYTKYGMMSSVITGRKSIDDVNTDNIALFAKVEQSFGKLDLEAGARYDDTTIDHGGAMQDRDYSSLNGYLTGTYNADGGIQYFAGAGKSSRVPDARELYFTSSANALIGTPTLDQTKNYEIDLGVKKQYENAYAKVKLFHSWLKDFIVYNGSAGVTTNRFENVDAKVYGIEFSSFYAATDALSFDAGLAYQRGKKDAPLSGQSDRDLAEIPPVKVNAAMNYETEMTRSKVEVIAADNWSNFDSDNGEQAISGYAIANIKWNRDLTKGFDITLGMDNVFDHTYAVSNTYKDLTLLASAGNEVILMNEPGRYIYANLRYRF